MRLLMLVGGWVGLSICMEHRTTEIDETYAVQCKIIIMTEEETQRSRLED